MVKDLNMIVFLNCVVDDDDDVGRCIRSFVSIREELALGLIFRIEIRRCKVFSFSVREGKTTLRESLLLHGVLSVRVVKYKLVADETEGESSLVTGNALIRKVLEDLLQRGLAHAVLLDTKATLLMLELTEEPADRLFLLGHKGHRHLHQPAEQKVSCECRLRRTRGCLQGCENK